MVNRRVLALNDDNHDTTFYFDSDSTGFDMRGFVRHLAHPHLETYEVRYVYLIDIPDDDIKAQEAFDVIDCRARYMPWQEAFDFLYDIYSKEW